MTTLTLNNSLQNYESFTKEELINRIQELENKSSKSRKLKKPHRKFNWDNVAKRHILLKFVYFGWDREGFVSQSHTDNTIEDYLFKALTKCCLIENRESSNYYRCGRTDAGVSAFSQVISLDVRSKQAELNNVEDELPYCTMLNRILPRDIRCFAWCPVNNEISARFDCTSRTYTYFFPRGNLNILAMQKAAKYLIGDHDFRNLCKMDVKNGVTEFKRTITFVDIYSDIENPTGYDMIKFKITSKGFLWHQIRCIMGVLFLIGEEKEEPNIIKDLLDIEKNPCKPQYYLANPLPLVLSAVEYDNINASWVISKPEMEDIVKRMQAQWTEVTVKSTIMREMLNNLTKLSEECSSINDQAKCLNGGVPSKMHKPLLTRDKCQSLENRIEHYHKKRKINNNGDNEQTTLNIFF